jgi:hypothetical protein
MRIDIHHRDTKEEQDSITRPLPQAVLTLETRPA